MRQRAGLSQTELARRLGTAQSAVARWESGSVSPRVATLCRIAKACGQELMLDCAWADDHDRVLIDQHLRMTPKERLALLKKVAAFDRKWRGAAHRRAAV